MDDEWYIGVVVEKDEVTPILAMQNFEGFVIMNNFKTSPFGVLDGVKIIFKEGVVYSSSV